MLHPDVEKVLLNYNSYELEVGESVQLIESFLPENAIL